MAGFLAKQLLGSPLDQVKGAVGDKEGEKKNEPTAEEEEEMQEARREAEQRRKEKHLKMEEERETMRQGIRDKYGLKKKETEQIIMDEGRVGGRKRKTPQELALEASGQGPEDDSLMNNLPIPQNMKDMGKNVSETAGKLVSDAQEKCTIQ